MYIHVRMFILIIIIPCWSSHVIDLRLNIIIISLLYSNTNRADNEVVFALRVIVTAPNDEIGLVFLDLSQ